MGFCNHLRHVTRIQPQMKFPLVAVCFFAASVTTALRADNARFDLIGPKIDVRVTRGSSTETFRESVRGYTCEELMRMFEGAGLTVEDTWGDFDGSPAGPASPRLILLASKK